MASPPPTEQIHLPGPSFLPIAAAAGVALALVGVVWSWVLFGFGAAVLLVAALRWVREAREEIAELPLGR